MTFSSYLYVGIFIAVIAIFVLPLFVHITWLAQLLLIVILTPTIVFIWRKLKH